MTKLFGESIQDLKYYWLRELDLDGIPLVVSRTGWSSELGYEIYLRDGSKGTELWEKIMEAGKEFNLKPGHTSSIRRIEGAIAPSILRIDDVCPGFRLNSLPASIIFSQSSVPFDPSRRYIS